MLRALRWLIIAVILALGIVLVTRGHLLVGSLLCGLAALRIAYLLSFAHRRRTLREGRHPDGGRLLLRGLRRRAVTVAAATIGTEPAQLRREFAGGRSIAEIAAAAGVAPDRVVQAIAADAGAALDRSVAEGTATPDAVTQARTRLPLWSTRLVYATRDDLEALSARRRSGSAFGPRGW